MIHTYDMVKLGQKLKEYRLSSGLTQKEVTELSKVSRDTIRRIENGHVIPRYDTIIILSKIYRFDLMKLFNEYALDEPLLKYYELIDNSILCNDIELIKSYYEEISQIVYHPNTKSNLVILCEAEQMLKLFESTIILLESVAEDKKRIARLATEGIALRHKEFHVDNYQKFNYNFIELRLLLIYAFSTDDDALETKTDILLYLLDQFNLASRDCEEIKLILKVYYNITYNYYRLEDDKKSMEYAIKGLEFAKEKHSTFLNSHLLGRKGLAMFYLEMPDYKKVLKQSLLVLEIEENDELHNLFAKTYKDVHKIEL